MMLRYYPRPAKSGNNAQAQGLATFPGLNIWRDCSGFWNMNQTSTGTVLNIAPKKYSWGTNGDLINQNAGGTTVKGTASEGASFQTTGVNSTRFTTRFAVDIGASTAAPFTIMARIKLLATPDRDYLFNYSTGNSDRWVFIGERYGSNSFTTYNGGSWKDWGINYLPVGRWVTVALTKTGATTFIAFNGREFGSSTLSQDEDLDDWYFVVNSSRQTSQNYGGHIAVSWCGVWGRAMTQAEMRFFNKVRTPQLFS